MHTSNPRFGETVRAPLNWEHFFFIFDFSIALENSNLKSELLSKEKNISKAEIHSDVISFARNETLGALTGDWEERRRDKINEYFFACFMDPRLSGASR